MLDGLYQIQSQLSDNSILKNRSNSAPNASVSGGQSNKTQNSNATGSTSATKGSRSNLGCTTTHELAFISDAPIDFSANMISGTGYNLVSNPVGVIHLRALLASDMRHRVNSKDLSEEQRFVRDSFHQLFVDKDGDDDDDGNGVGDDDVRNTLRTSRQSSQYHAKNSVAAYTDGGSRRSSLQDLEMTVRDSGITLNALEQLRTTLTSVNKNAQDGVSNEEEL
jgi:hypothetical protein